MSLVGDRMDFRTEYRELLDAMTKELDGGCEPDEFCLNQLKSAKKSLMICGKQEKKSKKRKQHGEEGKAIRINAAMAVWKLVLYRFCHNKEVDQRGFQRAFTMDGMKGYEKFIHQIKETVDGSIDKEQELTEEEKGTWKAEFGKPQGWIQNVAHKI